MGKAERSFHNLREETLDAGELQLERLAYAEKGGDLIQDLSIYYKGQPMVTAMWKFDPHASHDTHLSVLDFHWKKLRAEFTEVTEQIGYYHHAKTGKDVDAAGIFTIEAIQELSGWLVNQHMPDSAFAAGIRHQKYYPLTCASQRLTAMRSAAGAAGIRLDKFEEAIQGLNRRMYKAVDIYDRKTTGDDSDGYQMTADDDDGGDDERDSWRGEGKDDGDELPQYHANDNEGAAWQEAYDADTEKEDEADRLLEDYADTIMDFTNAANRLWMDAVEKIDNKERVTLNDMELQSMKDSMAKAQAAYDRLKAATQDSGMGAYELKPMYDLLEDEKSGPQPRMQRLISMASRPAELEAVVKKGLAQGRGR